LKTGLCILTGKDSNINSIENLNQEGKIVVVKKGTTGHIYAKENLKKARLLVVDKESSAVMEVIQQNADAFIYDQMSTYKNWQENLSKTNAVLKPFTEESWAIGIRQEDNQLREAVNKALFELKNEGLFDRLGDNYLSEQKRVFKEMGYPFYF
ncbi:MAG TPA: transporter substrate-binding domain-containing protein, partial [Candidatus Cloacimonadota bacterium]|nr:transporter substrate-binding domain-containing protein [Candidatus Cloacimonadota bacterium]